MRDPFILLGDPIKHCDQIAASLTVSLILSEVTP
jgi:hypothetical protein